MLQLLVESRPAGMNAGAGTRTGALASLLLHGAIVATAVLATRTVVLPPVLPPESGIRPVYVPPAPPTLPAPRRVEPAAPADPVLRPAPIPTTAPTIAAPTDVPVGLPPVDPTASTGGEPTIGPATVASPGTSVTAPGDAPAGPSGGAMAAEAVEVAAAPLGRPRTPVYPEALRLQRIEGAVIAEFVVDARGRVEEDSFRVLESAHALFEPAVRRAVLATRFRPARFQGEAVRQLVQQRFVFTLTR